MTKQEIRDAMLEVKADFEHANRYEQLLFRLMLAMNTPTTRKKVKTDDNTLQWATFQEWYELYPRKEAVQAAKCAWTKLTYNDWPLAVNGLKRQLEAGVFPTERRFIPLPATWLNAGRWDDEIVIDENKASKEKCCEKCGKPGLKYRMRGKLKVWRCEDHRYVSY